MFLLVRKDASDHFERLELGLSCEDNEQKLNCYVLVKKPLAWHSLIEARQIEVEKCVKSLSVSKRLQKFFTMFRRGLGVPHN